MLKQEVIEKEGTIVNGRIVFCRGFLHKSKYCISKSAVSMITTLFADRLAGEGFWFTRSVQVLLRQI